MLLTGYILAGIQRIGNCERVTSKHIPINFITGKEKSSKSFGDFIAPDFEYGQ